MQNKTATPLASYVERARKVLQHEQRTHHQDRAITSGGLAAFTARWYDETCAICKQTGLDAGAIHRFVEHLEGYRQQDPMQRVLSVQAALAVLNEIDGSNQQVPTQTIQQHTPTPSREGPSTPAPLNGKQTQTTTGTEPPTKTQQAEHSQTNTKQQAKVQSATDKETVPSDALGQAQEEGASPTPT